MACGACGPHTPGVSGAARPQPLRFRSCGGCPPPRPGVHFWPPKSEPKNRQNQWFWIPLSESVFIKFGTSLHRIKFLSSNLRLGVQRCFGCRPVKGGQVSIFSVGRPARPERRHIGPPKRSASGGWGPAGRARSIDRRGARGPARPRPPAASTPVSAAAAKDFREMSSSFPLDKHICALYNISKAQSCIL